MVTTPRAEVESGLAVVLEEIAEQNTSKPVNTIGQFLGSVTKR